MREPWGRADALAVAALLLVFAAFVARSWLAWGHLDYDYGREMYVPERLAAGDVIYRDVRYFYGPFSPYLHALLYRLVGPQLAVLYASGLIASALLVVALYGLARMLASPAAALLGALLATVDLMFFPGHTNSFSYVFPYSYPAVHGLLFVTTATWAALIALERRDRLACVIAGTCSGLGVVTKQDWGAIAIALVVATSAALLCREGLAGWKRVFALVVPFAMLPLLVVGLLTLAMPLPTLVERWGLSDPSYSGWRLSLRIMGFAPGSTAAQMVATLAHQFARALPLWGAGAALLAACAIAFSAGGARRGAVRIVARVAVLAAFAAAAWTVVARGGEALIGRYAALPLLLAAWLAYEATLVARALLRRERPSVASLQRLIVVGVALAPLLRVPAALEPRDYANFALPLAILLLAHLVVDLLPETLRRLGGNGRAARLGAVAVVALAIVTVGRIRFDAWQGRTAPLRTPRGTMYFHPLDPFVPAFRGALDYVLAGTSPTDTVVAIPAEVSLNFFSGRGNRLYESGLIAVVSTDEADRAYVAELERDPPQLILVSNRSQKEYGRKGLGIDYGHAIHRFLSERYEPVATFGGSGFDIVAFRPRAPHGDGAGSE